MNELTNLGVVEEMVETAKKAMPVFGTISGSITQYQISKTKANEHLIQAKSNDLTFHHEKNKSKQSKALGGMKLTHHHERSKSSLKPDC